MSCPRALPSAWPVNLLLPAPHPFLLLCSLFSRPFRAMNRSSPLSRRSSASSTNPSALFDVPSPLREFHDQVGTSGSLDCGDGVALDTREGGYKTNGQGKDGTRYCGDKEMPSYMWWESNMDVDCDGAPDATTGICAGDGSYPGETAFADDDGKPIDAMKVQYVVIDQDDSFDATKFGVQPLSVVAVICGAGGQMTFGIWADTNALGSMGEASVTLARVCFGDSINGNNGHGEPDVLYIAFPGSKAETVPSSLGSDEEELFLMGKKLVEGAFGGEGEGGGGSGSSSAGGGTETGKGRTTRRNRRLVYHVFGLDWYNSGLSCLFLNTFTLYLTSSEQPSFWHTPAVLKEPRDGEGFWRLRRKAKFYRAMGSKLDGVVQKALEVLEDEEGEIIGIVLEALKAEDDWRKLRYYSLLSREEAESLYSHLHALHTTGHYIHGMFEAENVFFRPSSVEGQPGSLRLFNFVGAESRHDCPGD
ncbi:hypothetical protein JCM10213_005897 [Rhodosporidiobolus nylandii]